MKKKLKTPLSEKIPDTNQGIDLGKKEFFLNLETASGEELKQKSKQIRESVNILEQDENLDDIKKETLENLRQGLEKIEKAIQEREGNMENPADELLKKVDNKKDEFDKDGKLSLEQEQAAEPKEKIDLADVNLDAELITQKTKELLSQELGFIDIEPKDVLENLTSQDLGQLQKLMKGGEGVIALEKEIEVLEKKYEHRTSGMVFEEQRETIKKMKEEIEEKKQQAKILKENEIIAFWKNKIEEIFISQGRQNELVEEKTQEIAKNLNDVIQQTINAKTQEIIAKFGWAKGLKLVGGLGKNIGLMFGATALISGLGLVGGLGIAALAGGLALTRLIERRISGVIREKNSAKTEQKFKQKLEEIKTGVLKDFFANEDSLKKELSGAISNEVRRQTGKEGVAALNRDGVAPAEGKKEIMESNFSEIEKKFYLNALVKVKAEHLEINKEQQHNMAIQMAMTLSQYERNNFEAKKRLEDLKNNKPKVYELVQKFNLLQAGVPDKEPEGMNKEEKSLWEKYKYDLISLGIGTAVGTAIRTNNLARMVLGTISGIGVGYMFSEMRGKRVERKGIKEIEEMIFEAEKVIEDIEFPSEKLPELRENAILVQSKLEIGLLDSDALLKSRAENFIYNVKKIEIANQKFLNDLLKQQQDNNKKLGEQIEKDVNRIENKTKKRRILFMVGGAIGGFLIAGAFTKHNKKVGEDEVAKPVSENEPVVPEPIPTPQENLSDAIVGKGEGAQHAFIRQLIHNPKKFGYQGNVNDASAIKLWAERTAHRIALDQGIVKTGEGGVMEEIRTRIADKIAYQLENIDGKITVKEIDLDTNVVGDPNAINSYEYDYTKPEVPEVDTEAIKAEASTLEPHPILFNKFRPDLEKEIPLPEPMPISSEVQHNIDSFNQLLQQNGEAKEIDKAVENLINNYKDDPSLVRDASFKESINNALNHRLDDIIEKGHGLFSRESVNNNAEDIVRNFAKINGLSLNERNSFINSISGKDGFDIEDLTRFTQNGRFDQSRLESAVEDFKKLINSKTLPTTKEWTPRILNIVKENGERQSMLGRIKININNEVEVDYKGDGLEVDVYNQETAKNIMKPFEEQEEMIKSAQSQLRMAESIEKAKSDLQNIQNFRSSKMSMPQEESGLKSMEKPLQQTSFGDESLSKGLKESSIEANASNKGITTDSLKETHLPNDKSLTEKVIQQALKEEFGKAESKITEKIKLGMAQKEIQQGLHQGEDIKLGDFQEAIQKGLTESGPIEPMPEDEISEIISSPNIPFMKRPDWFQNPQNLNLIEFDQEKFNQLKEIISKEVAPTQLKVEALEMMDKLKKSYPDMYEKMSAGNYDQPSDLFK